MLTGKRKWLTPVGVMAVGAAVVLVLLRMETAATAQVTGRVWGATSLGTPVVWPAGFDAAAAVHRPAYSPSGRYLAFKHAQEGRPMILELATGELHGLYDLIGGVRPNLQCYEIVWLSDERLCVHETWMAEEDRQRLDELMEDPGFVPHMRTAMRARCRVIDWVARVTVFERSVDTQQVAEFNLIAGYADDLWIVSRKPSDPKWHSWWVYDPAKQEFVKPLVQRIRTGDWIGCGPRGPWVVKWLLPYPTPEIVLNVASYDVEFVNYETGETRRLGQVLLRDPGGLFITADGRYVVASFFDQAVCRWAPVVFDTLTGQQHELPATESWKPHALNDTRGAVLASVLNRMPDESWAVQWVEIPLSQLLPQ